MADETSTKVQIIPAILATDEEDYRQKIEKLWLSNIFDRDWIQIDLMDGEFVKNKSVSVDVVKKYPASFRYEAHLMVNDPYLWVSELKDFSKILRFIAPIELDRSKLDEFIELTRAYTDAQIGFSVNPQTPLNKLEPYLKVAESILLMSVHPGSGGQDFITSSLEKIQKAASLRDKNGLDLLVGVDGGISLDNISSVVKSGADYVVIGSRLIEGDINENLEKIWEAIYG